MDLRPPRLTPVHVRRVRPRCRLWLLWLVAALAPLWLGPTMLPIERAIAEAHHVCACGMAVGTCGCPECEDLERQQRQGEASPRPVLKGECDRSAGLPGAVHLPPIVLPRQLLVVPAVTVTLVASAEPPSLSSLAGVPPPTPPPRRAQTFA